MSKTETAPSGHASLDSIPFREPIIDAPLDDTGIERSWRAATEASRRAIISDPSARQTMETFGAVPLSETLPLQAMNALGERDDRVRRLAERPLLREFVSLPAVPAELYTKDVIHAPSLLRREQVAEQLAYLQASDNPRLSQRIIERSKARAVKNPGVAEAEKQLTLTRYRYARDIKLLALASEMIDRPPQLIADGETLHGDLPSGAHIALDNEALQAVPDLMHPETWRGRRQLKDRVHLVDIGGQSFILKERKTDRHRDVKEHGHRDGLTSREEYETAQHFQKIGPAYKSDAKITWEKPVGYVEFADGFQFCLFEADPRLSQRGNKGYAAAYHATQRILSNRADYQQEFEQIRDRAVVLRHERPDLLSFVYEKAPDSTKLSLLPHKRRAQKAAREELSDPSAPISFEEFAKLKASLILSEAAAAPKAIALQHGYVNEDQDGHVLLPTDDPNALVEVIAFDFEYYTKDAERPNATVAAIQDAKTSGQHVDIHRGVFGNDGNRIRMREAAQLALFEAEGYALPKAGETLFQ